MGPARGQALATEPWSGPVTSARTVRPSPTSAAWTWSGEEYRRPTRQCDGPAPSHSTALRQTLCRPRPGVGVVDRPSRHSTCPASWRPPGLYAETNRRAMASRHAGTRVTRASGRDGGRVAPVGTRVPHLPARGCHHAVGGLPRRSGRGTLAIVPAVHDRTSTCGAARSSREPAPSVPSPAGPDGAAANLPGWRGSVRRQPSMRQRGRAMRPPGHPFERDRGRAAWGSA